MKFFWIRFISVGCRFQLPLTTLASTLKSARHHEKGNSHIVTKAKTILTHAKYAMKFEISSIIFLQISGFLAEEVLKKAASFSRAGIYFGTAASIRFCNFRLYICSQKMVFLFETPAELI